MNQPIGPIDGHAASELDVAKALGMMTITFYRDSPDVAADHVAEHFADLVGIADTLT